MASPSVDDWPEFHDNSGLTGDSVRSSLSVANAGQLGVRWMANLYGAALDSPVVAYDQLLGQTLAYIGTEAGDVEAVNAADGQIIWSTSLGSPVVSSPLVSGGAIWVATSRASRLYKLSATTGAVDCSTLAPHVIESTPTVATLPNGNTSVFVGTTDTGSSSGPLLSVNTANCAIRWQFSSYHRRSGPWDPIAYAVDANHVPLVVFGTADPDSSVYAVNAETGAEVWRFQTDNPPPGTFDVGAGVTISPPGRNGFASGVAYVPNKYGVMYALDLTTGAKLWDYRFAKTPPAAQDGRSTAALDGTNLVFGHQGGVIDLDAVNGTERWQYADPSHTEVLSSPAIAGGEANGAVVAAADLSGAVHVLQLSTGDPLYQYQTANYVSSSPAISGGNILIASADGFLYDFAVGGQNASGLPTTTVSTPAPGTAVANPNGQLTVAGTASGPTLLGGVEVAVQQDGSTGPWWDAATTSWSSGPVGNPATLASPRSTSSDWSLSFPVPPAGGTYRVVADAVSAGGQADVSGATTSFSVATSKLGPHLAVFPTIVPPGGKLTVVGGGFAPGESVAVSLPGVPLATAIASETGDLGATTVIIPGSTALGNTAVEAAGQSSGRTATAALGVLNAWGMPGQGVLHQGYEPDDPTFYDLVQPGGQIFVRPAWLLGTGAPVVSSPVTAGDVAYVGNTAGQLEAVDVHNAAVLWSWAAPSATNISPSVDLANGMVLLGSASGSVDAIAARGPHVGATLWTQAVGGTVAAPVFAAGVVYVASTTGTVQALSETTGHVLWSATVSSGISSSPTADLAAGLVIVGEQDGTVAALHAATGAVAWSFAGQGAVVASPLVAAGRVYAGSAGSGGRGKVYALDELTGQQSWSFGTKGAVAGALAYGALYPGTAQNEIFAGSEGGELYALSAATGARSYQRNVGGAVTGVAAVEGVVFLELADGYAEAWRSFGSEMAWHHRLGAGALSGPIIANGAVYLGTEAGNLDAFTSYGQAPT